MAAVRLRDYYAAAIVSADPLTTKFALLLYSTTDDAFSSSMGRLCPFPSLLLCYCPAVGVRR